MKKPIQLLLIVLLLSWPLIEGCSDTGKSNTHLIGNDTVFHAAGKKYKRNFIHNLLFGKHYRELWATKVKLPVLDPDSLNGGLRPLKIGGSFQSISIHVEDASGKRYVIRSVDKDPSAVLPVFLRTTFLNFIISDQTSASNPFAALIVDDLAEAAGIYHTNPVYYYVPEEIVLIPQAKNISGKIVMFEEKPNNSWKKSPVFDSPAGIISSEELLALRFEKQNTSIDSKLFLKSRIFDIWINDWDRHAGQWDWLKFKHGDSVVFKPLPKDRDGAFYMFDDGLLPFLASRWWGNIKFQSFHPSYENVEGLLYNSVYLDNLLLTQFTKEDWTNTASELVYNFSDSVIEACVKNWPPEIYKRAGKKTIRTLISRRDKLISASELAYDVINRRICIPATDESEIIEIERKRNETTVKITSATNGKILFQNSFPTSVTKKIAVNALKGKDKISVIGDSDKGVIIEIYGGEDEDVITDKSSVSGFGKKTRIFDSKTGNKIDFGVEAADCTTDDPDVFSYNRTGKRNP